MTAAQIEAPRSSGPFSLSQYEGWRQLVEAPRRQRPDHLELRQLRALSRRARDDYEDQRSVWHANIGPIQTRESEAVMEEIDDIVESNRQDFDKARSSVALDAHPGLGKTTLVTRYGVGFHRRQLERLGEFTDHGHVRIPVAVVRVSSSATMRSLSSALCGFYAHPAADRGNAAKLAARAAQCAREAETRVIIVDDVHFVEMSRKGGRDVVNHFKWWSNEFEVSFIFVGVALESRGLLTEGLDVARAELAQTGRRWTRFTLNPFTLANAEGRKEWRRLLLTIEREVVLAKSYRGMIADDLADYLYARSTGHFASLMTLINRGCRKAIKSGEERLTPAILDQVRNDAAAEQARQSLEAAMRRGTLSAAVRP